MEFVKELSFTAKIQALERLKKQMRYKNGENELLNADFCLSARDFYRIFTTFVIGLRQLYPRHMK